MDHEVPNVPHSIHIGEVDGFLEKDRIVEDDGTLKRSVLVKVVVGKYLTRTWKLRLDEHDIRQIDVRFRLDVVINTCIIDDHDHGFWEVSPDAPVALVPVSVRVF